MISVKHHPHAGAGARDGLAARVLEPVHLYTACGTFTAANSSVNIFEVTASTYSAHDDTEAQAALLGYVRTRRSPAQAEQQQQGNQQQHEEAPMATPTTAPTPMFQRQAAPPKLKNNSNTHNSKSSQRKEKTEKKNKKQRAQPRG